MSWRCDRLLLSNCKSCILVSPTLCSSPNPCVRRSFESTWNQELITTCFSPREEVENRYMIIFPLKHPQARNLSREQNLQQYTLVRKIYLLSRILSHIHSCQQHQATARHSCICNVIQLTNKHFQKGRRPISRRNWLHPCQINPSPSLQADPLSMEQASTVYNIKTVI